MLEIRLLLFIAGCVAIILSFILQEDYRTLDLKKATKTPIKEVKGRSQKTKIADINLVDAIFERDVDGDTAWFKVGSRKIDCRFFGVDAPESCFFHKIQKGGIESKAYLCSLLRHGDKVKLRIVGSGNHDREAVIIFKNGVNINEEMVKKGFAWVDSDYAKRDSAWNLKLIALQDNARKNRLGLWGLEKNPTEPKIWRKQQRELMTKRRAA